MAIWQQEEIPYGPIPSRVQLENRESSDPSDKDTLENECSLILKQSAVVVQFPLVK